MNLLAEKTALYLLPLKLLMESCPPYNGDPVKYLNKQIDSIPDEEMHC